MTSLLSAACLTLLSACATSPRSTEASTTTALPVADAAANAVVVEAWISSETPAEELDSLAVWPAPDGRTLLIASGKASNALAVYDGDTGQRLRSVGSPGKGPLQFNRPNGVAIFGDLLFVVERDNRRVQVLQLPEFKYLRTFGEDVLQVPYGIWLHETAPGVLELFVTDSFMADFRTRELPPMHMLDQRVKRFGVQLAADGSVQPRYLGSFGDVGEAGALRMVESIAGDPAHDRLLIAEEDRRVGSTLRDYTLAGSYRGYSLPPFTADAEGVALWACDAFDGYWVAVDQLNPTVFRVFDRRSLKPKGSFSGEQVANTDGQALHASGTARFPAGALYTLQDDKAIAAFDLRDIVKALDLSEACLQ